MNEVKISEVVAAIMESSNSDELCDRFRAAYECRDQDEDLIFEDLALNLMEAISSDDINSVFYAFCGTSATDILKKGLFIPDDRHRFYDEYEEVEAKILFGDGTTEEVEGTLNTETREVFDFKVDDVSVKKGIAKITIDFCDLDCEVYPKSDMYADDKWSFWYADEKWR